MNAHKLEILILDFGKIGADAIKSELENAHYSNDCISPTVMSTETKDIGPWSDEHPLNILDKCDAEYARLFAPTPALRSAVETVVRVLERDNIDLHNHGYSDLIMCRDELKTALAAAPAPEIPDHPLPHLPLVGTKDGVDFKPAAPAPTIKDLGVIEFNDGVDD